MWFPPVKHGGGGVGGGGALLVSLLVIYSEFKAYLTNMATTAFCSSQLNINHILHFLTLFCLLDNSICVIL